MAWKTSPCKIWEVFQKQAAERPLLSYAFPLLSRQLPGNNPSRTATAGGFSLAGRVLDVTKHHEKHMEHAKMCNKHDLFPSINLSCSPKSHGAVVFNAMTDSNIDSHHLSRTLNTHLTHLDWSIWTLMASGFTVSPLHLPFGSSFWVPAAWKEVKFHVFSGVPCLSWMNSKTSWYKLQLSCKTDSNFSKDLVASSGLKISCNPMGKFKAEAGPFVCYNRGPNFRGIHSLYGMRNFSPRCHRDIWKVD